MNLIDVLSSAGPFFAVVGFISTATLLILTGWIVAAAVVEKARKRWTRWRTPQIPAPKPLAPLDKRVPGANRPWIGTWHTDPNRDRVEATLRRTGDDIRAGLDANPTPADIEDVLAEANRITRHAANH